MNGNPIPLIELEPIGTDTMDIDIKTLKQRIAASPPNPDAQHYPPMLKRLLPIQEAMQQLIERDENDESPSSGNKRFQRQFAPEKGSRDT